MNSDFAVLFDMNGVIIDDMKFHLDAWQVFAKKRDKTISPEEFDKMLAGRTNQETLNYIIGKELTAEEIFELSEEKEALYREVYTPHLKLLEGLYDFILDLKAHKIPIAVATAAPIENVDMVMDGLQIRELFDAIIDASQVQHGKPAPDIFLKAAEALKTPPANCLVFEDSLLGLEAARRAGIPAIGVTTAHSAEKLKNTIATINDFKEMSYIKLTDILQNKINIAATN